MFSQAQPLANGQPLWAAKKLKSIFLSQSPQSSQRKIKKLCALSELGEIFNSSFI